MAMIQILLNFYILCHDIKADDAVRTAHKGVNILFKLVFTYTSFETFMRDNEIHEL